MKRIQLSLSFVALAAAATFSLAPDSGGFTTISANVLGLGQRDFRIFNNFTDPGANANQTPDPNFPGALGAEIAIWKGCIEWGSRLHGDGGGDPEQPFDLGSGGANFDLFFAGHANEVGSTNDNIHSQISGSSGGVLGFTEGPSNNGWRIRYYEEIEWHDGPGPVGSSWDLQSVACAAMGHGLGLGDSGVSSATMAEGWDAGEIFRRSLAPDDIAGVQFVYGPATGTKPFISAVSLAGGQFVISGGNFDPLDNSVWFTPAVLGYAGNPVELSGLASTAGGTRIAGVVPADAGPGDVLVRVPGTGFDALSNAWPFDPGASSCSPPTNYCIGAVHSGGVGATLSLLGTASVAANTFTLEVNDGPANKFGIFYYGPNQIQTGFGDGVRCVGGMTRRLPIVQTDSSGYAAYAFDLSNATNVSPGSNHNFQFWFRDPMGPGGSGFNTSDGLNVQFCE